MPLDNERRGKMELSQMIKKNASGHLKRLPGIPAVDQVEQPGT
jgi:hypothetical protein